MQNLILGLHSLNRWLIVAVGLAAIVILAIRLANKGSFDGPVRGLTAAFSGLMDLQMLLGLVYFIWNGLAMGMLFAFGTPLIRHRWEHLFIMVLAVAHLFGFYNPKQLADYLDIPHQHLYAHLKDWSLYHLKKNAPWFYGQTSC